MKRGEDIRERMNLLAQETEKRKRLNHLRKETLRKISFFEKKAVIEPREVYHLVRTFFKGFLEKQYEFTIGELRKELKNVYISNTTRQNITSILDRLDAIEYTTVKHTHEELLQLLKDFTGVVKHLVHTHTQRKSLWQRLTALLLKREIEPAVIIAELPVIEHDDAYHVRIYTLIEKCYIALDRHNMRRAKAAYKAVLSEYASLSGNQREEYYSLIHQTYLDIANRSKTQR